MPQTPDGGWILDDRDETPNYVQRDQDQRKKRRAQRLMQERRKRLRPKRAGRA